MKSLKCSLISIVLFFNTLQISAGDFFTDKGSLWPSGAVSFTSIGYDNIDYRKTVFLCHQLQAISLPNSYLLDRLLIEILALTSFRILML
jgi:hypothetical protein